jgi:uncharacterized protein
MVARQALVLALAACGPPAGGAADGEVAPDTVADGLVPVELATVGMDPTQQAPVVLLREATTGKIVPIWVGVPEAQSILAVMLGVEMPRPMTHDLLASVIRELGASVEEVVVHDVRETTFIGRVTLRPAGEERVVEVDSRPSDALALAIRTGAPIRVAERLLAAPPDFDFLAPEADEQVVRMLGATVVAPSRTLRERYGLPDRPGLVVVGTSSAAADEGLRRGDLILEINGVVPRAPMDFFDAAIAGETLRIRYWRAGQEAEVELSPLMVPGPERRGPAIRT